MPKWAGATDRFRSPRAREPTDTPVLRSGASVTALLNANTWDNNNDVDPKTGRWSPTVPNWQNQNQITLSYGGPIIRNKTFFFALFDQNFVRTREIVDGLVLTDTARQGIFRYFEGWTPDDADGTPGASSRPAVDFPGKSSVFGQDPSLYTGHGLICFSVFGNSEGQSRHLPDELRFGSATAPAGPRFSRAASARRTGMRAARRRTLRDS